jgi:hypothetical protein
MSTPLTRSFVSVVYMMGARGKELSEKVPEVVARRESTLLKALESEDRDVRARFLAVSLRDLATELNVRCLEPARRSEVGETSR